VLRDRCSGRENCLTDVEIVRAIKAINVTPDRWVTLEESRKTSARLDLRFGVFLESRRKKKVGAWNILCEGIHEASITDFDGGGLALYPTTHPAARQYRVCSAELSWPIASAEATVLGALYRAHTDTVDDWIPFDRCVRSDPLSESKWSCEGPEFLLRAYAKALRANLIQPRLVLKRGQLKKKRKPLSVLHFGCSFVVAARFTAEQMA
jgi:hypothetical protein